MKPSKVPFSYVVLRYMHDVLTREFVNVAVLVYAPEAAFLGFEKLSDFERVRAMFPGAEADLLRRLLGFLSSRVDELGSKTAESLVRDTLSASDIAKEVLPIDDSALQWSAAGGGITVEPEHTLRDLFERLVVRHLKPHPPTRREDSDVWKSFGQQLRQRDISHYLREKLLMAGEFRHRFENAWEPPGGYARIFQPLSFDLVERSDIVEKAIKWNGVLRQLRKANPDFFIYLLLGRPGSKDRIPAFEQARETLQEDGNRKELYEEDQASEFASKVETEIRASNRS